MSELKRNAKMEEVEYVVYSGGSIAFAYSDEEMTEQVRFYHERGWEAYVFKKEETNGALPATRVR